MAALSICYLGKQMSVCKAVPESQQLDISKVAFCRRCAGAGEPFTTAAGVLGLMAVWRCFYAVQLGKELGPLRPATFQACTCQCLSPVSLRVTGRPVAADGHACRSLYTRAGPGACSFCCWRMHRSIGVFNLLRSDVWNFRTPSGARVDRERDGEIVCWRLCTPHSILGARFS